MGYRAVFVGLTGLFLVLGCGQQHSNTPTPSATVALSSKDDLARLAQVKGGPSRAASRLDAVPARQLPKDSDLKRGSRPFEGKSIVRQSLVNPLPEDTEREQRRLVEEALTFDPSQPETKSLLRQQQISQYLLDRDAFTALDAIGDTLREKRLLDHNGQWLLGAFYQSLLPQGDQDLENFISRCREWLKRHPESMTARSLLGDSLISWAWEARGSDLASEVNPEAWKLFGERLERAVPLLTASAQDGSDPYAYGLLITAGMGLQYPQERVRTYLDSARAIDAIHVHDFYEAYSRYLLPRWHGSAEEHAEFVEEMVRETRSELGEGLYAVLVSEHLQDREIKTDRRRCMGAYDDLLKRNPRSFVYFMSYAELSAEYLGRERTRALYQQLLSGERRIPLEEGDRLRLKFLIEKENPGSNSTSPTPSPSPERSVTLRGIRWGMKKEEVLEKLGPPESTESFGKKIELRFPDGKRWTSVIIDPQSSRVVRMGGGTLEIDGRELKAGASYAELVELLGPPGEIRASADRVTLLYEPHHLVVRCSLQRDKLVSFDFIDNVKEHVRSIPPITLQEWKQNWQ